MTAPTVDALAVLANEISEWKLRGVHFNLAKDSTINATHHDGVTQEVVEFICANGPLLRLVIGAGDDVLALNRFRFAKFQLETCAMDEDFEPIRVRKLIRERTGLNKDLNELNFKRADIVKSIEMINAAIEEERESAK